VLQKLSKNDQKMGSKSDKKVTKTAKNTKLAKFLECFCQKSVIFPEIAKHGQISQFAASTFFMTFEKKTPKFDLFIFGQKSVVTFWGGLAPAHYMEKSLCIYTSSEGWVMSSAN
jgi:hypothetical protein